MSSNGDVGTYYDIAGDGFRDKPMERMSSKQNSEIVESSQGIFNIFKIKKFI